MRICPVDRIPDFCTDILNRNTYYEVGLKILHNIIILYFRIDLLNTGVYCGSIYYRVYNTNCKI